MNIVEIASQVADSGLLGIAVVVIGWMYWQEKNGRKKDNDYWIAKLDEMTKSTFEFHEALKKVIERNGGS
jgi:hypothetical protein